MTSEKEPYIKLLLRLIATPSFSKEEDQTASVIYDFMENHGAKPERYLNNIFALNKHFDPSRPTILLNSHHDTVRPNPGYSRDPFSPDIENGKLYGLGSNDAGGCLVSLLATFLYYQGCEALPYNLVFAATAEEEISGRNGIEALWPLLPEISFALVGEPTLTQLAIAEKGLLVVDCTVKGTAGHAAREEGENALYKALDAINWIRTYRFPRISDTLGEVKMTATIIQAGSQHNVVPAECRFTVDIRVTDAYTHEEVLEILRHHIPGEIEPRSVRLRPSSIPLSHPVVQSGLRLEKTTYGSPTTSDQALMPVHSLKCGPGDSARSHSADEFIYTREIEEGIDFYIRLLEPLLLKK